MLARTVAVSSPGFDVPITPYMSKDVAVARVDTPLDELTRTMNERALSALPILAHDGGLVGVVSRTDLIIVGAAQAGRRTSSPAMPLPRRCAADVMSRDPLTVPVTASIRDAAQVMAAHAIHRVFVLDGATLVGVIGAVDIAAAVRDAHSTAPLSTIMTAPLVTIDARAPLSAAVEMLEGLRVTALVVIENGTPVGVFSQVEALAARDLPRSTPIDTLYDAAVICLPDTTELHAGAAQVARHDVRRVIVAREREAVGIVTALDFARFAAW